MINFVVTCDGCPYDHHSYFESTLKKAEKKAKAEGFVKEGTKWVCDCCINEREPDEPELETFHIPVPVRGYHWYKVDAVSRAAAKKYVDNYLKNPPSEDSYSRESGLLTEEATEFTFVGKAK